MFTVKEAQAKLGLSTPQAVYSLAKRLGWVKTTKAGRTAFYAEDVLNYFSTKADGSPRRPEAKPALPSSTGSESEPEAEAEEPSYREVNIFALKPGDVFIHEGERWTFVRIKKMTVKSRYVSVVAQREGHGSGLWSIKFAYEFDLMKDSVRERGRTVRVVEHTEELSRNDVNDLVRGDLFVIDWKDRAQLYRFDHYTGAKVVGINPLTGGKVSISRRGTRFVKIENLPN